MAPPKSRRRPIGLIASAGEKEQGFLPVFGVFRSSWFKILRLKARRAFAGSSLHNLSASRARHGLADGWYHFRGEAIELTDLVSGRPEDERRASTRVRKPEGTVTQSKTNVADFREFRKKECGGSGRIRTDDPVVVTNPQTVAFHGTKNRLVRPLGQQCGSRTVPRSS